jgi:ubiquinone/menaquinone biosynthesis C-methylase UbiE
MPYPAKKPFKKFSKPTYGKKPFGFKSAYKKPFADKFPRPASDGPKIRTATKIGESAPRPDKPFTAMPAWKTGAPKPGYATRPYGSKPSFKKPFSAPTMRTANKPGEFAPRPSAEFAAKPGFQMNTKKSFNSKWTKPVVAAKPVEKKVDTSWGGVAQWYHDTVEDKGSYQKDLILPNLIRLMDVRAGEMILDLACGEGFFSRRFNRLGAKVVASDISKELIEIAKKDKDAQGVQFEVAPADKIPFVADASMDKIVIILALQNIENVPGVFAECSRVLKPGGKLYFVINHPAFRIPKQSSWGWEQNADRTVQYRRVDRYLSELREYINMHPGDKPGETTISFHRPMQYFVKSLKKNGFGVTGMEEWTSDRKSQPGPRAEAENRARIEIPMFMFVEAKKI